MKNKIIQVVVGSKNPVKIRAVKQVFKKVFKKAKIVGIKVESGVADQPLSFEEAYIGALNRAKNVRKKAKKADYYVGIEAGVQKYSFGWTTAGLVVILDKKGEIGVGISSQLLLPKKIVKKIKDGKELGVVLDDITGRKNIKHQEGAFGLFTNNLVTRKDAYKHAITCALSRFIKTDFKLWE